MLRLRPVIADQTHEELFLERYARLYGWLVQFTDGDRDLARDLVQDAFVHFTFVRPELGAIRNLDAYLFELARNLHLSQVRRAVNSRIQQLSIIDYDSTELGLRMIDLREQIQVQDELRRICHYACVRKESAWAGSVLILRFFYGYYPSEIARVLRNTRGSVDVLLRCARHEAKIYLENPHSLGFMKASSVLPHAAAGFARESHDFLNELRQMIFHSREGECLSAERLHELYQPGSRQAMECAELAHLVSCPACLDAVNGTLGMSPLSERYPLATLGKESRSKTRSEKSDGDGNDRPGDGTSGGGATGDEIRSVKRRVDRHAGETFEHKPNELYIAVNGYTLGSQTINAKRNELTLDVNIAEPISFVEVFSEQQVRLLFGCVENPPAGAIKQPLRVALSDRRSLELTLKFSNPWPNVQVVYSDPLFIDSAAAISVYEENPSAPLPVTEPAVAPEAKRKSSTRLPWTARAFARSLFSAELWLKPQTITAVLALLLMAASFWSMRRAPVPSAISAGNLLQQSSTAEELIAARTDQVVHRTMTLEERQLDCGSRIAECGIQSSADTGKLISHRKIEVWQSAEKGITASRLYDERGSLLAGDWIRADGVQTIYHHGARPQLQLRNSQFAIRNFDDVWRLSPSAKDFAQLIGNTQDARVEERSNAYVITYEPPGSTSGRSFSVPEGQAENSPALQRWDKVEKGVRVPEGRLKNADAGYSAVPTGLGDQSRRDPSSELLGYSQSPLTGLNTVPASTGTGDQEIGRSATTDAATVVKATLILSRLDLHATEETLLVQQGREVHEYHFTEISFERHSPSTVAPAVFEPEPELLTSDGVTGRRGETEVIPPSPHLPVSPSPTAATADQEVEVLRLLNQAGVFLRDQVSVVRTPAGQLVVGGVVETDQRKQQIINALAPVASSRVVRIEVETVAEVLKRQQARAASEPVSVEGVQVTEARIPVDPELRKFLSTNKGLAGDQLDSEVRQFAERLLARSNQARLQALALKPIIERFSPDELQGLSGEARGKWRSIVTEHVRAVGLETAAVRRELEPLFPTLAANREVQIDLNVAGDADLIRAVKRLMDLASANDEAVRRSFSISANGGRSAPVRTTQFWHSLASAESLAARIDKQ